MQGAIGQPAAQAYRCRAGDRAGRIVLDDDRAAVPQHPGKLGRPASGQRRSGRVLRPRLQEHRTYRDLEHPGELAGDHALGIDRNTDCLDADRIEQVEHRRERRVLHRHPVAELQQVAGDQIQPVHRAVHDGDPLDRIRPIFVQQLSQRGQHRIVEVAARGAGQFQAAQRPRKVR